MCSVKEISSDNSRIFLSSASSSCALLRSSFIFEMGKYNECATMFNVVVAEQNVEDTFKVIKQLLENVDTICDFQKSRLYKHIKFQDVENPYAEEMKKELIAGFQNEEDFAYMKGYKPWKKLLAKY